MESFCHTFRKGELIIRESPGLLCCKKIDNYVIAVFQNHENNEKRMFQRLV